MLGALYASVLFFAVINALIVQPVLSAERAVSYRERAAGMYSFAPWVLALVSFLPACLYICLFVLTCMCFALLCMSFAACILFGVKFLSVCLSVLSRPITQRLLLHCVEVIHLSVCVCLSVCLYVCLFVCLSSAGRTLRGSCCHVLE